MEWFAGSASTYWASGMSWETFIELSSTGRRKEGGTDLADGFPKLASNNALVLSNLLMVVAANLV